MVVHHDIRPVYIKINIYIYVYVNYGTGGSAALLGQSGTQLTFGLGIMFCFVTCLFVCVWLVFCRDSKSASLIAAVLQNSVLIN